MDDYNYICLFRVLVFDEVIEQNKVEHGFCFTNDFSSAAWYLEHNLYGDNLLEIQHMELFDTCPVISAEAWEHLKKSLEED